MQFHLFQVRESHGSAGNMKFRPKTNGHAKSFACPQRLYENYLGNLKLMVTCV